jgi:hypothetical protein
MKGLLVVITIIGLLAIFGIVLGAIALSDVNNNRGPQTFDALITAPDIYLTAPSGLAAVTIFPPDRIACIAGEDRFMPVPLFKLDSDFYQDFTIGSDGNAIYVGANDRNYSVRATLTIASDVTMEVFIWMQTSPIASITKSQSAVLNTVVTGPYHSAWPFLTVLRLQHNDILQFAIETRLDASIAITACVIYIASA